MVNLTQQELQELEQKFSTVVINETIDNTTTKTQLSSGKFVHGYLTEDNTFIVKSVSSFLCG